MRRGSTPARSGTDYEHTRTIMKLCRSPSELKNTGVEAAACGDLATPRGFNTVRTPCKKQHCADTKSIVIVDPLNEMKKKRQAIVEDILRRGVMDNGRARIDKMRLISSVGKMLKAQDGFVKFDGKCISSNNCKVKR